MRNSRSVWPCLEERGCDGCCSLETFCKVQGFLYAITSAASLVNYLGWGVMYAVRDSFADLSIWSDCPDRKTNFKCLDYKEKVTDVILGSIISLLLFASSVAFLRGIYKKRPSLLVHYIRLIGIDTAISLGAIFTQDKRVFYTVSGTFFEGYGDDYLLLQVTAVLIFALKTYMFVSANSLWHKMMDESEQGQEQQPNLDSVMIYTTAMQEKEKEAKSAPALVVTTTQWSSVSPLPPADHDCATGSSEPKLG